MAAPPRAGAPRDPALARGLHAFRGQYLAWIRRHPLFADAAVVAVAYWLAGPRLAGIRGSHGPLAWALVPVLFAPLIWRRRAPLAVFAVIFAAAAVQALVSQELTDDVTLLVAFYTVAAYSPPRLALAAAGVLEGGGVLVALRDTSPAAKRFWLWVLLSATVAVAGFIGYYARTRRAYLASLVDRAERLERERDAEARVAAAAERTRIAREMHDIVAHSIAVMIALADGAAYTAAGDPDQAASIMGEVSATGRSALAEMRRLLGVMRHSAAAEHAPQPTLADVDELLATVRAAGLPTRLAVAGQAEPLPPSAQLALYRIIQEALTNTLKHAAATAAEVRISYRPGEVDLEVTDDGCRRPDPGPGPPGAGHGIIGMRERAAVFGGAVSAGPRPGGGWRVRAVLRPEPEDA